MASVGGCIEAYVRWAGGDTAFDGGLNRLKFGIRVLKRDVIEKEDELPPGIVSQRVHNLRQFAQLLLCDLYEAKPALFIFTDKSLDGRGFSRTACTDEENVIGGFSLHKGTRVLDEQLFLPLIPNEISHLCPFKILYAAELIRCVIPMEDDIRCKLSITIASVEGKQCLGVIFRCLCCLNPRDQEVLRLIVDVPGRFVVIEKRYTEKLACRQGQQRIEQCDVMIECLTQTVPRRQSCPLHGLRYEVCVMREDVQQILREQITAESLHFRCANEMCSSFRLRCRIICVPLEEAENGVMIEFVQYQERGKLYILAHNSVLSF